jgi:hypothetical protein
VLWNPRLPPSPRTLGASNFVVGTVSVYLFCARLFCIVGEVNSEKALKYQGKKRMKKNVKLESQKNRKNYE